MIRRVHSAGRAGARAALTSDPLPWRTRAQRKVAQSNHSSCPPEPATEASTDHADTESAPARMSWARLLKRGFDIDIAHCPNSGGVLKIIAAIEDPPVIVKFLRHLGLTTRAPPRAPARRVDLFRTI